MLERGYGSFLDPSVEAVASFPCSVKVLCDTYPQKHIAKNMFEELLCLAERFDLFRFRPPRCLGQGYFLEFSGMGTQRLGRGMKYIGNWEAWNRITQASLR